VVPHRGKILFFFSPGFRCTKPALKRNIKRAVESVMKAHIETKMSCMSSTGGEQIYHNSFVTRSTNLLSTSQGITDPASTASLNRIGDKISLSGVSIKMMLELNERYSIGTFRVIVVKCARGDTSLQLVIYSTVSVLIR
jgi:hypothetical protein